MRILHWFDFDFDTFDLEKQFSNIPTISTNLDESIDVLHDFSQTLFQDLIQDDDFLLKLQHETGSSLSSIQADFKLMTSLFHKEHLYQRVKIELGNVEILDQFVRHPSSEVLVRAYPRGKTLHVTASNVYFSFLDSLIMGILTKNPSIIKLSHSNHIFAQGFLEKLRSHSKGHSILSQFALVSWKGGDTKIEDYFKSNVDQILAWGGEGMLKTYLDTPRRVHLMTFGPKVSFQILSRAALKEMPYEYWAKKIAMDIIPWNQQACSSPQNLFIEEGVDVEELMREISSALEQSPARAEISSNEYVEIHKQYFKGLVHESMGQGKVIKGENYLLHFSPEPSLSLSPLNRSLIIKTYASFESLSKELKPYTSYLQSCSYGVSSTEEPLMLHELSLAGVKRFAPMGSITKGKEGAPHDGRFILRDMVHFISNDMRVDRPLPLIANKGEGYVFSSGGTTGEPKTTQYSFSEFDLVAEKLAYCFKQRGMKPKDVVANLFVAGNMWSSFLAVDRALEKCNVLILPIGGYAESQVIIDNLLRFKPKHMMGIPSLLVKLAEEMEKRNVKFQVDQIFYAGERLSDSREDYLRERWKVKTFSSSGYATVEAGLIGYQCSGCEKDEHHLFSDLVSLEIKDGQGVVSSALRSSEKIHHYFVGDKMEWKPAHSDSADPVFKILGRADEQIQIWSSRFYLSEIESLLQQKGIRTYKSELKELRKMNLPVEIMELYIEEEDDFDTENLKLEMYHSLSDVKSSLDLDFWMDHVSIIRKDRGTLERNSRTGKMSTFRDLR